MSKKKLIGIIGACILAVVAVIIIVSHPPTATPTQTPSPSDTYTLSVSVSPPGAGSVSPSGGEYESGLQITLSATPASGYTFDYWSGAASGSANTVTITMDSSKTITANFKAAEPTPVVENRPPFIMRLDSDGWRTVPGTTATIRTAVRCEAVDPDGDTISFDWEVSEGTITGTGKEVQWVIPARPGRYVVEVVVSDGKGGTRWARMTSDLESVQVIGGSCDTTGRVSFSYEGR